MARNPEIVVVAQGTEEHPRNGGVGMVERKDGSIFLSFMRINRSDKPRYVGGDDAPSDLVTTVSRDGGKSWDEPRIFLAPGPDDWAAYTPALLRLQDGSILFRYEMYHYFVQGEPWRLSAYACWSHDECKTFSDPVTIWADSSHLCGSNGDVIQLSTGRIVVPACYMEGTALQEDGEKGNLAPTNTSMAGCFYSDDGKAWKQCDNFVYLPMRGSMEPKIAELKDGRLMMVMRTQLGSVFRSFSEDGGQTWSNAQTTGLQSPESCPGLIRIPQTGDLLLIWNDSPYDPRFDHYGLRSPLSLAVSKDEGRTWLKSKSVETDPEYEFTNPSAMVTSDGNVLIAYETSKYASLVPPGRLGRSCMSLRLAIVDLDWLYE